ncbi:UNVERIFIED_CONTAM: hypothetical protein RMT77_000627 [Armadillidium vulgare]
MTSISNLLLALLTLLPFLLLQETGGRSLIIRRQVPKSGGRSRRIRRQIKIAIPKIPSVLQKDDSSYAKPNVDIDIFMSLWEAAGGLKGSFEPCSVIIPADSSFELFPEPLKKEEVINELKKIPYDLYIPYAISAHPFQRNLDKDKVMEGESSLTDATFGNPASAPSSYKKGYKMMAWKSLKNGTLLINGARVLFELGFNDDKCVVLVAESFPFMRGNSIYGALEGALRVGQDLKRFSKKK